MPAPMSLGERKGVFLGGGFVHAMTDPGVSEVARDMRTPVAIFHGARVVSGVGG